MNKLRKVLCVLLGGMMILGTSKTVKAEEVYGSIDGYSCYGRLSGTNTAIAATISSLTTYHYAEATMEFYYTDENGHPDRTTRSSSNASNHSISAEERGIGSDILKISASSHHKIVYNAYTWYEYLPH